MPIDIDRIRAICFDVDGTLSDTDDQWVEPFARLLSPAAFRLSAAATRAPLRAGR